MSLKHVSGRTSYLDRKIKRKRKFKQSWSTIPPISIKRTITFLFNSIYYSRNHPCSYTSSQLLRLFHHSPDSGRWSILNTSCKKVESSDIKNGLFYFNKYRPCRVVFNLNYNLYIYIFHKQNHLTRHCELLDYDEIAQLYQTCS